MHILIVDDVASNRKLLRVQLEAENHTVAEAADGIAALALLGRERVDAIVSDILMPRMDGYRLCHEVRKSPTLHRLRFILYSSTYTSPTDVRLSETVGADQFIAKPAPIDAILGALQLATERPAEQASTLPDEAIVLEKYSAVLVSKLEEKNTELQRALAAAQRAHEQLAELNRKLEERVAARTAELAQTNAELRTALANVKELSGLLPICSHCKQIRNDQDYWQSIESYLIQHSGARFTHGICPACFEKQVAELDRLVPNPPAPSS